MALPHFNSHTLADWKSRLTKGRSIPRLTPFESLLYSFSPAERFVLYTLSIFLALSCFVLVVGVARSFSVVIPARGGSITEGEIGPVRFINPILTLSSADEDLTSLVYSGLMRATPDGTYVPDLAQSYVVSENGTVYTFKLRPEAVFHDGTPVTSADVVFTVQLAQNPSIKSTHQADWAGVRVSAPDQHTVVFTLPHSYAPFLDNATLGILPKHEWENVSDEEFPFSPLNTHPIGSGPYKVTNIMTDSTGSATRYELEPFSKYVGGRPYLDGITFVFYPNEDALVKAFNAGSVQAIAGIDPEDVSSLKHSGARILSVPLPRVFGVFFNQGKNPVFSDPSVREALESAVDKQSLVNNVLHGYGTVLNGPIPPGIIENAPQMDATNVPAPTVATTSIVTPTNITAAQATLQRAGWKFDPNTERWVKGKQTLAFTLATADEPELVATANDLATAWRAAGIPVTVQIYPLSDLNTNVLRPRDYDAILFGQVVGRTADLFAFWHSSQRNDPGLNLALYANAHADQLLTEARGDADPEDRTKLYSQFAKIVEKDRPALFLYSPDFLYVVPDGLRGVQLGALTNPAERFLNARLWYTETARVWEALAR